MFYEPGCIGGMWRVVRVLTPLFYFVCNCSKLRWIGSSQSENVILFGIGGGGGVNDLILLNFYNVWGH
jgi:hypothetical protein